MRLKLFSFFFITLIGCAAQPAKLTSSSWPESLVNADRQTVADALISEFSSSDGSIESVSPALISMRFTDDNAFMQKAAFGCSTCADPYIRVNFILSEDNEQTKVVSQYWRMVPKYNGSEERHEITDSNSFNTFQEMLWRLRDKYIKG